eukprot:6461031-Amphidinium_carterae.1
MALLDNDWWLHEVRSKIWAIRHAGKQNEPDVPEAVEKQPPGRDISANAPPGPLPTFANMC